MGFPIINCSWGLQDDNGLSAYDERLASTISKYPNSLFVIAAGNNANDNDTNPMYPASFDFDNILAVASTDSTDSLSSFSNYGVTSVDIAAPGSSIWSTYKSSSTSYASMQGTSMACPLVASAAALVKAKYPDATPAEIIKILEDSADVVPALEGKVEGARRLNAYKALTMSFSDDEIAATTEPTATPTAAPTATPTQKPTDTPTPKPTATPTQ
jgi:subtilisin family serine protease